MTLLLCYNKIKTTEKERKNGKEQNKNIYDGQNRCRRCDKPLSDPNDVYGWRCAQIVGLDNYQKVAATLDENSLKDYNAYVTNYLGNEDNIYVAKERTNWFVDWTRKMFKVQNDAEMAKIHAFDDAQKNIQREIWRTGAQSYLREQKGFYTSAWMLEHSLEENPSDIWRGNDSRIAYLINHDSAYLEELDKAISNANDGKLENKLISVQFNTGDLYYSIHKSDIYLTGYERQDGTWIVNAKMSDTYDFTEIQTFMADGGGWSKQAGLVTIANDAAVLSQALGVIHPYNVTVDFWTVR